MYYLGHMQGAREEANALYNEMSDTYQILLSMGADRVDRAMSDAIAMKISAVARTMTQMKNMDDQLRIVGAAHDEIMPQIRELEVKTRAKTGFKGTIQPGAIAPKLPPSGTEFEIPIPHPGEPDGGRSAPGTNGGLPFTVQGVNWWVIGGVGAGLLLLTMMMRGR